MDIEKIIDYIMKDPARVNYNILREMIKDLISFLSLDDLAD